MQTNNSNIVIVLSDENSQLAVTLTLMNNAGFKTEVVSSDTEAIDVCEGRLPSLFIAELAMHGFDGLKFCQSIRQSTKLASVPILLMGDLPHNSSIVMDALRFGSVSYVHKPIDPLELFEICIGIIGSNGKEKPQAFPENTVASIIKDISDVIMITDAGGKILYASPSSKRVFGYLPIELVGTRSFDHISPDDVLVLKDYLELIGETRLRNEPVKFRLKANDGRWVQVETFARHFDLSGEGRLTILTMQDSSEIRNALAAKRESDTRLAVIFENADVGISLISECGRYIQSNPAIQRFLGYSAYELQSMSVAEVLHPDNVLSIMAGLRNLFEGRIESFSNDVTLITRGKRAVTANISLWAIHGDEDATKAAIVLIEPRPIFIGDTLTSDVETNYLGKYTHFLEGLTTLSQKLGSARDIESVFASFKSFIEHAIPCSSISVSLWNSHDHSKDTIFNSSHVGEMEVSEEDYNGVVNSSVLDVVNHGEVVILEEDLVRKYYPLAEIKSGKRKYPLHFRSALIGPMFSGDEVVGVIEIKSFRRKAFCIDHATILRLAANSVANAVEKVRLVDIERSRYRELKRSQRLESVGRLASGIAHDFNNMLTAINGFSELTLKKMKADDPLRRNIEEIREAGRRSATLTRQLISFSRRYIDNKQSLDLAVVVKEAGTMLKRVIGEDVEVELTIKTDLANVWADPDQITQILLDLSVNSRSEHPAGKTIVLEVDRAVVDDSMASGISGATAGDFVSITLGVGHEGEYDPKSAGSFVPYIEENGSDHDLLCSMTSIVSFVKDSGGFILINSDRAKEQWVKIHMPRLEVQTIERMDRLVEQELLGTESILLVEDEAVVRGIGRQILETCGYHVVEACDGIEASAICQQDDQKFDMVLTDIVMPLMSGQQLANQLTQTRPGIKTLFMSGYLENPIQKPGSTTAADNFIQKPFTFRGLALKVRNVLDSGIPQQPLESSV